MEANANIRTTKLIGRLQGSFEGLVRFNITSNDSYYVVLNDVPEDMKDMKMLVASEKAFAIRNMEFFVLNCIQGACLFLFAFALFYYQKKINTEIAENHKKDHH